MVKLFEQYTVKDVTLRNRIVMSPMCQYSAGPDAKPNDWHFVHYGTRAVGGAGLIILEMTQVERRARLSEGDLGLYTEQQLSGYEPIVRFVKAHGAAVGIQLGHAGRKAYTSLKAHGPEPAIGPSPIPFAEGWAVPVEMSLHDIDTVVAAFRRAAQWSERLGFDVIELHGAHGYLLHQFLSPLSNQRSDDYGGSLENRLRLARRVISAVREVWPERKPLFMRLSCSDWDPAGLTVETIVEVARHLKQWGVDLIDCSSGGNKPVKVDAYPGYQVPFAGAVRRGAGIATGAVGLISDPQHAEEILQSGSADLIILGRELLRHPYWPLDAARSLGAEGPWPQAYLRAR